MEPEIRKPTDEEKKLAQSWPVWEKQPSQFPWQYDETETCLIIEGQVTVTDEAGKTFEFTAGDWVVFPKGTKCTWKITKNLRKHYNFG